MARTNSLALPAGSTQSSMVEACSLPLRAMHIAPFSGTQRFDVAIKQVVTLCSKPDLNALQPDLLKESKPLVLANQEVAIFKEAAQFLLLKLSQETS